MKYAIKMNWRRFNELYETRQKVEYNLNNFIEKKGQKKQFSDEEFIQVFADTLCETYEGFVSQHKPEFETLNSNFVIDFETAKVFYDNSGCANFWVQSLKPTQFDSQTGPYKNITIQAVFFEIKWNRGKVIENNIERIIIKLDVCAWFHPYKWGGRNKIDYAPIGKISFTGFNRIISEAIEVSDSNYIDKIKSEFETWFYKCMGYYFL
jgi:hypothetical protein